MELSNQLPGSHPLTAPIHPPERVTGPPELHHSEGRYHRLCSATFVSENGKQILTLTIWPDVLPGRVEYYVAPSFDIKDDSVAK